MKCYSLQDHLRGEGHEPYEEPPSFKGGLAIILGVVFALFVGWCIKKHLEDEGKL